MIPPVITMNKKETACTQWSIMLCILKRSIVLFSISILKIKNLRGAGPESTKNLLWSALS
jgi:hypothetical protein